MHRRFLERHCAREFRKLATGVFAGWPITLILFDYGDKGSVAFATNLGREALVSSFESLVRSWKGEPRTTYSELPCKPLPSIDVLKAAGNSIKRTKEVGYALLVGIYGYSYYIASGNREDMGIMLDSELLPKWRVLGVN